MIWVESCMIWIGYPGYPWRELLHDFRILIQIRICQEIVPTGSIGKNHVQNDRMWNVRSRYTPLPRIPTKGYKVFHQVLPLTKEQEVRCGLGEPPLFESSTSLDQC